MILWAGFGFIYPPCDDPHITIVGGTTLTTANNAWASETVWNWGVEYGVDGIGSGGGISSTYAIPSWQTNVNMTANQRLHHKAEYSRRGADGGQCLGDLRRRRFRGFWRHQLRLAAVGGLHGLGQPAGRRQRQTHHRFHQPGHLCHRRNEPNYTNCFHDIITGNKPVEFSPNLFYAVPGYDLCTGWGTPIGTNLIAALAGAATPHISPPPPPYGSAMSALNGGNPNGAWESVRAGRHAVGRRHQLQRLDSGPDPCQPGRCGGG